MLARAGEGAQGKKENKTELEARLLEQEPNSLQWGGTWGGGRTKRQLSTLAGAASLALLVSPGLLGLAAAQPTGCNRCSRL